MAKIIIIYLIIIVGAVAAIHYARALYRQEKGKKISLPETLANDERIAKINKLCRTITDEAADDQRELLKQQVATVLQDVSEKLQLIAKIDQALAETESALQERSNRQLSPEMQDSINIQFGKIQELRRNRQELDEVIDRYLVGMENLHLSLLEAISGSAGLDNLFIETQFENLKNYSRQISRQSRLERELQKERF